MALNTNTYGYVIDPLFSFCDQGGKTIANGYVRVFLAGTSTPVLTYRNFDGALNAETIELDNSGRTMTQVIASKGNLYKVCVYDAEHSQEDPILTVDKVAVIGASVNATSVVTGLDSVTVQEENFIKATVEGTGVELALDPTEVTSEVSTIGAAETAAPDYVLPLLDKTGEGDSKKISLANLFKFALDWISRLATTVTSFASGDFIAVSNTTNGARKMSKDTLLELTAQNALAGNVAPEFVPNSTTTVAGQAYVYNGSQYVAKEDYQGPWDASKFDKSPVSDIFAKIPRVVSLENLRAIAKVGDGGAVGLTSSDVIHAGINGNTGEIYTTGEAVRRLALKEKMPVLPGTALSITVTTNFRIDIYRYGNDGRFLGGISRGTTTKNYTVESDVYYIQVNILYPSGDEHTAVELTDIISFTQSQKAGFVPSAPYTLNQEIESLKTKDSEHDLELDTLEKRSAIAKVGNGGTVPVTSSYFIHAGISGSTGDFYTNDRLLSLKVKMPVLPGTLLSMTVTTNYRVEFHRYGRNGSYIGAISVGTTTKNYTVESDVYFIRVCVMYPSGDTTTTVQFSDIVSFTQSQEAGYVPSAPYTADPDTFLSLVRPIYAPTQKPANGNSESDFDAETLTPSQLYDAFAALIDEAPAPDGLQTNPKLIDEYYKEGDDASNAYKIKAYTLCVANRFAWFAADRLYAWKNGSTIIYTDSCSPRVGDATYSDASRTSTTYTVSSYTSGHIVVNSVTYDRDSDSNITPFVLWSTSTPKADGTTSNITLYNKDGVSQGSATLSDKTHCTLDGVNYTRCTSFDYNTEHKGTIVLWGNEHGPQSDPAEPAIILYRLAKDYVYGNCSGNEFFEYIKDNYKIVIVPVLNPYGLATKHRNNANGVNINRNYDTIGWSVQADADKGSYAGDQNETQFIMNLALNMNVSLGVDIHCLGYVSNPANSGRTHYSSPSPNANLLSYAVATMRKYGFTLTSYYPGSYTSNAEGDSWLESLGIAGGLIEMNAGPYAASYDGKQHGPIVMGADYALLLNTIRMWIYKIDSSLRLKKLCLM